MKSLLVLSLLVLGTQACCDSTKLFSELQQQGASITLTESTPRIDPFDFNDSAKSVLVNGFWIYYENIDFNPIDEQPRKVFYAYGLNATKDLPEGFGNKLSSVRKLQDGLDKDKNRITFYEGRDHTGREFSTNTSVPVIAELHGKISSLITSGEKPWTVYTDVCYQGDHVCLYPHSVIDLENLKQLVGYYPNVEDVDHISDNSIKSVREGCYSDNVHRTTVLKKIPLI
ncbi:hypothetical protein GWK47_025334 [Chionoecetes opilio]|uniref:Uncharacterized protein n=1 Tax=Chionoecetes opilio TaxID=41210 RepID=A0A8J8WLK6_CHIOP|nr:hypothetical protein GWK47_025334 [Chionoecetes opilio]